MCIQKIILFGVVLFLIAISNNFYVQAQEIISDDNEFPFPFERQMPQYKNNIGFTTSLFSGVGFHYKRDITQEHSAKIVLCGWHRSTNENIWNEYYDDNYESWLSFGLEYQYHFYRNRKYDLYVLAGYRIWYEEDKYSYAIKDITSTNSIGVGIGTEYRMGRHFVMNLEGGFVNRWRSERYGYRNKREIFQGFAVGCGIGFIF